jgi:hypothetical protein
MKLGRVVSPVFAKISYAWAKTVQALAGAQGELAFYGDEWGSDGDFEKAERSAREIDPDNSDGIVRRAREAAAKIVRGNRAVISALAVVLERNGRLSGAEIDGIIGTVSGRLGPGPSTPDMTPIGRARRDAERRFARRDYEGVAFIENWIRQQERGR